MHEAMTKVYLCFDFGLRRIGVAAGQTETKTAMALTTLIAKEGTPIWQEVDKLVSEWQPNGLVVGWPLSMDGREQGMTELVEEFAMSLHSRYDLPVFKADERLTSVAAKEVLIAGDTKKPVKKNIDSVAAQIILENWLKARHSGESRNP